MIKREKYLKKIRGFYNSDLIKVITGVRRCGKSVLLKQIIQELENKEIKKDHIIYINLEDVQYIDILDAKNLNDYIKNLIKDKEKYYIFFDEIQNVSQFELAVNSLRATLNCSIFLTGSNGKLLSGELATHLSGRYVSFKMMPFTFKEVCEFLKIDKPNERDFKNYIEWGGMPQIYNLENDEERKIYLQDLYNSIILRDIVERSKIKDVDLLNRIIQFILENVGGIFSANSIKNFLKQEHITTSADTILNYVDSIVSSLVINKVNRYDIRGKRVMSTQEKYYMSDLGIMQLKKSNFEKSIGGRIENIVYNELVSRGYEVYIGKTDKGEIDFIVNNFGDIKYIQVAEYLASEEVISREFGAYKNVNDNFPKYVITLDILDHSKNGIKHINLIDFLLNETI